MTRRPRFDDPDSYLIPTRSPWHERLAQWWQNWGVIVLLALAVLAVSAISGLYQENRELREQVNAVRSKACPAELKGKGLTFSTWEPKPIFRPKYAKLTCYYGTGVQG